MSETDDLLRDINGDVCAVTHYGPTLDPWCTAHRRSVACCIRALIEQRRLALETLEALSLPSGRQEEYSDEEYIRDMLVKIREAVR